MLPETETSVPELETAPRPKRLSEDLRALLPAVPGTAVTLGDLFQPLAARGSALMALFSALPFCLPIPLLGLSTPFGLLAGFFGLRLMLGLPPWLPRTFLNRPIPYPTLLAIVEKGSYYAVKIEKILHPRLTFLASGPAARRCSGLVIVWCALLMALPLPIPGTNILPALPIVLIGLGLMERDGLFVLIAYCIAAIATLVFASLAHLILVGIHKIVMWLPLIWEKL